MTEVRLLNDEAIRTFAEYVTALKTNPGVSPPSAMLYDESFSQKWGFVTSIEAQPMGRPFSSAYELGDYLNRTVLVGLKKSEISHNYQLWNWLALFFFDELCPTINGVRSPVETPAYVLAKEYSYQRYYRHIVRSAWALVAVHGVSSKVLLSPGSKTPVPVAIRAEPQMQIAATQQFVESKTIVKLAYALYFDETTGKLKAGSSTKDDGGPRRLVSVLNQFDLTYDLNDPPVETLLSLLPSEFDRFKAKSKAVKQKSRS